MKRLFGHFRRREAPLHGGSRSFNSVCDVSEAFRFIDAPARALHHRGEASGRSEPVATGSLGAVQRFVGLGNNGRAIEYAHQNPLISRLKSRTFAEKPDFRNTTC